MEKSRWKLPYIHSSFFKKKKLLAIKDLSLSNFRNSTIPATFVGKRCYIYNGAWNKTKAIDSNMVGFKVGEFSITKRFDAQRFMKRKSKKRSVNIKGNRIFNSILWVI